MSERTDVNKTQTVTEDRKKSHHIAQKQFKKTKKEEVKIMEEIKNQTPEGQQAEEQNQTNQTPEEEEKGNPNSEVTVESLMAEIAQMKVNEQKTKRELDKALKEVGEKTKALRAKQTAEELEDEAKREEKERHDAYVADLEEFKQRTLAKDRYLMQGMSPEMAGKAAAAEVSGDMDALTDIQKQHTESQLKAAKAEWQKSIPQPQFGTGEYSSMTREDIVNMKDRNERRKAIAQNMNLFQGGNA